MQDDHDESRCERQQFEKTVNVLFDGCDAPQLTGERRVPQAVNWCNTSPVIIIAIMSALISKNIAANRGMATSANIRRWRRDSLYPLVSSIREARWQR